MKSSRIVSGVELHTGELWREDIEKFVYQWTEFSQRKYVYASNLDELRKKERKIKRRLDRMNGCIDCTITLNEMFSIWLDEKIGVRENTLEGYVNTYKNYLMNHKLGKMMLIDIKKPIIRAYYLELITKKLATISMIAHIQQVLHQVLQLAVDYDYLEKNPSDKLLGEIMRIENTISNRRIALTKNQQAMFLVDLGVEDIQWKVIFLMFLTTGVRVGELVALQWKDINFEEETVTINKTLVYYKHADGKCAFEMHKPKTVAGCRDIPLMSCLKKLLLEYKTHLKCEHIICREAVGNYNDFVFINEYGCPYNQQNLNRMLKRLIKGHNKKVILAGEGDNSEKLLPNFSCHCLRHTFATRFCECDPNYKKLQYLLGHKDIQTTLNLYAHGSLEAVLGSMEQLEKYMMAG